MEVMVVILVSTLVLAMVGGTMIFITTTTSELIQEAEEIEMAKNIANYFVLLDDEDFTRLRYDYDKGIVLYEDYVLVNSSDLSYKSKEIIFSNTGLETFEIYRIIDTGFLICYMKFQSGRVFEYIIGYYEGNI